METRETALVLLAGREYATAELRQKLRGQGHGPEAVEEVLRALTEDGLLSDGRFAESFVRSRVAKGYGPVRIGYELQQRAIDDALVLECLARYQSEWSSRVAAVRRKRFGTLLPKDARERARQFRFLQYRGFTPDQIRALLAD